MAHPTPYAQLLRIRCRRAACQVVVSILTLLAGQVVLAQFPDEAVLDPGDFRQPGVLYAPGPAVNGLGGAVAAAGDVNRDQRPDLLIAADGAGGDAPGRVFLVLDAPPGRSALTLGVDPPDGAIEVRSGSLTPDRFGAFVAAAGDVDADGFDDFLIGAGAEHGDLPGGTVYLVFGARAMAPSLTLSEALPERAVAFTARTGGASGLTGAAIGDINNDGFADMALGYPMGRIAGADGEPAPVGRVAVVLGGEWVRSETRRWNLEALAQEHGYVLTGSTVDGRLGAAIAPLGDVDGDDFDDFALGAPGVGLSGSVYVLFGNQPTAIPDLKAPDGIAVVQLFASSFAGAQLGAALAGGLDATGDGGGDLLVGAPMSATNEVIHGAAFLVEGTPDLRGGAATRDLIELGAITLFGPRASLAGSEVALVPDLSGDDRAELLIGAPERRGARGAVYLTEAAPAQGVERFLELEGTTFHGQQPNARLGAALAGLEDRSGDGRGELVIGMPGVDVAPGVSGVCFELFHPLDLASPAPRQLQARILSGRRVLLTWVPAGDYRFVRIFRDGQPVGDRLPGNVLHFVDVRVGPGTHVYEIEADDNPQLRSRPAEVLLGTLPVRDLACRQLPGTTDVIVRWVAADLYQGLQVFLDGQPVSPVLPPSAREFQLAAAPGPHLVEVGDPISDPDGNRAACLVDVIVPVLPPIEDFTCEEDGPRQARLSWTLDVAYTAYVVVRDGVPIAEVQGANGDTAVEFVDEDAPLGSHSYEVVGFHRGIHPGPATGCILAIPGAGQATLRGRVVFDDGRDTPLRRGFVRLFDSQGAEISRAQVGRLGHFAAPLGGVGPYRVIFEVALPAAALDSRIEGLRVDAQRLAVEVDGLIPGPGRDVTVLVPPPMYLVATVRSADPGEPAAARWNPLRSAATRVVVPGEGLRARRLVVPLTLPVTVALGSESLVQQLTSLQEYFAAELGSPPRAFDIVAYGAAGLAARVFAAAAPELLVRKLVLLGTPNLGTLRSVVETRGELVGRPLRVDVFDLAPALVDGPFERTSAGAAFFAAAEQTPAFLREFNDRLAPPRGAEVHLVAGTGGRDSLDPILQCEVHDDRVCEESALGAFDDATLHRVNEPHQLLGRAPASIAILLDDIHGDSGDAEMDGAPVALPLKGGGAGVADETYPSGPVYSGLLEPGGSADLLMISDTSDSIIVILNSDLPGGIQFNVREPSGDLVDPASAGALLGVTYFSYGDGEGHEIQAYEFRPSEVGAYLAELENIAGEVPIAYTLEMYLESDITLDVAVAPAKIVIESETVLAASLFKQGVPITGGLVEAALWRPDGSVDVVALLDDGQDPDAIADDGIYAATTNAAGQVGVHSIVVTAENGPEQSPPLRREVVAQLRVQSNVAQLLPGFDSGTVDNDGDGLFESLWIEGRMETSLPGSFFVSGKLTDPEGEPVATANTVLSLDGPQTTTYRLVFGGFEIATSALSGPYTLSEVQLFDGSVGLVLADEQLGAYTTEFFAWNQFGLQASVPFVRGDTNADGDTDVSDAIAILEQLFTAAETIGCVAAADTNADGGVDIADASFLLTFLFVGGEAPAAPYPTCGSDLVLACGAFLACE